MNPNKGGEEAFLLINSDKLPQIKKFSSLVHYLFENQVEICNKALVKDQFQVLLHGLNEKRSNAKKFILALCNPETTVSMIVEKSLLEQLETLDTKNDLMRKHSVFLSIGSDNKLYIQGRLDDVKAMQSSLTQLSLTSSMDDSIIWLDSESTEKPDVIMLDDTIESQMDGLMKVADQQKTKCSRKKNEPECQVVEVKSHPVIELSPQSVLKDYGAMFSTQAFESSDSEKLNKVMRIQALISAMPEARKNEAISQLNQIQANRSSLKYSSDTSNFKRIRESNSSNEIEASASASTSTDQNPSTSTGIASSPSIETSHKPKLTNENFIPLSSTTAKLKAKNQSAPKETNQRCRSRSTQSGPIKTAEVNNDHTASSSGDLVTNLFQNSSSIAGATISNSSNLRYIIIDASNVAREHGNQRGRFFSCRGIKLVVDYFIQRGHTQIRAMLPRFRRGTADRDVPTTNPEILDELEKNNYITYTPSRKVQNTLICPYDDRFIIRAAVHHNAVIVSNDNYRDLMLENEEWRHYIENNLLQYSFVDDLFLIADDPMGRRGPHIDQLLSNNKFTKRKATTSSREEITKVTSKGNLFLNKQKNQRQLRSNEETAVLKVQLAEVFPQMIENIRKLLTMWPHEKNIDFFMGKLMGDI